jgi:hypothetical protein
MTDTGLYSTTDLLTKSPEKQVAEMLAAGARVVDDSYSNLSDPMQLYCRPGTGSAWCPSMGRCVQTSQERCAAPPYVTAQALEPCVRKVMATCDLAFSGASANACKLGAINANQPAGQPPDGMVQSILLFPGPFAQGKAWALEICPVGMAMS